jgi:hypothetical protein
LTWTQLEAHSVWQSLYGFDSKEGLKTTQRHTQSAWHRAWPYLMTEITNIRFWQYSLQCNAKWPYWWVVTWLKCWSPLLWREHVVRCTAADTLPRTIRELTAELVNLQAVRLLSDRVLAAAAAAAEQARLRSTVLPWLERRQPHHRRTLKSHSSQTNSQRRVITCAACYEPIYWTCVYGCDNRIVTDVVVDRYAFSLFERSTKNGEYCKRYDGDRQLYFE